MIERADDDLELQVGIVLIQANLVILRRIVVVEQHRAPFNVEDTVRRAARDRGEDTAVSTGEAGAAAQAEIGALVLPNTEDGEVIQALTLGGGGRQAVMVAARLIGCHEVQAPVGADVHAVYTSDRITGM